MGRFKNVEIEGLLFANFGKLFMDSFDEAIKSSGLPEEEALKKIAPKFQELLQSYEESVSSLYLRYHKFSLDTFLNIHFSTQKKIADAHKDSFEAFIMYANGCYVIFEKIIAKLDKKRRLMRRLKFQLPYMD